MKKNNIAGLIVYAVILILAVVFGVVVLQQYITLKGSSLNGITFALFILGAVVTGVAVNSIIFEIAHVIGAKMGGYDIVSVNILNFKFYKDGNKFKFKFESYDGLTGETKIVPKKNAKKEPNPTMHLLLGTIIYALEIVAAIFVFIIINAKESIDDKKWAYFIITAAIVGGFILLYNIIPFQLDAMNDGYKLRQVSGEKNRRTFNNLLRMENGEQVSEEETVQVVNEFSTDIKLNNLYKQLSEGDYASAEKTLREEILTNEKVSKNVYMRARAQLIYVVLMSRSLEDSNKFYEEEVSIQERRTISDDVSMDCIRAYILMSGLLDKSRSECNLALKKLYRAYKSVPEQRKDLERKLFNDALNKVIEAHPSWELNQFIMIDPNKK